MRFSKFLKNMNRGIALLILVAIGFGCYVAYDYASFKKEKPEIEAFLKEYTQKTADFVLLPEGKRSFGQVDAETVQAKIEENTKVINQYWTIYTGNGFYNDIQAVKQNYEEILRCANSGDPDSNGLFLKAEVVVNKVEKIKKTSPNTAEASVTYLVSYEYQGNPLSYVCWLEPINEQPVSDDHTRACKYTDVTTNYGLTKTSDGWKISWISGWSYSKSTPEIIGEEGDHGSSITD